MSFLEYSNLYINSNSFSTICDGAPDYVYIAKYPDTNLLFFLLCPTFIEEAFWCAQIWLSLQVFSNSLDKIN